MMIGLEELKAENDTLKQQLRLADAANAELVAEKEALHVRVAAMDSELQSFRQAVAVATLDRDEILDAVFSYVGIGDYLYSGAVSRRWNGRYVKLCYNLLGDWEPKLFTNYSSTLITAARLQFAIESGLHMADLQIYDSDVATFVARLSLDPIAVLIHARSCGLEWTPYLALCAVWYNRLQLLQWLQKVDYPLDVPALVHAAVHEQNIDMLNWLRSNTAAEWTADLLQRLFTSAGVSGAIKALQWLRDTGAEWPKCSVIPGITAARQYRAKQMWAIPSIEWALANGSSWGDWQCSELEVNGFACYQCRRIVDYNCRDSHCAKQNIKALDLFAWAHANGCPCTCSSSAAEVAAKAAV
jgi:hypothetical protein